MRQHFFQTVRNHAGLSFQFFCTLITIFPATPVHSIEKSEKSCKLTLNLMGLTGVNAVLKQHLITEWLSAAQLQQWHQWYYEQLYRAWSLYHWPVQSEKSDSPFYDHFLGYCQTNPRDFPINYAEWGFCFPNLSQLHEQLQQHFSGTHRLQTTVGWLPILRKAVPQRLGNNAILGNKIPLSKCGLIIQSVVPVWDPVRFTKAILLDYFSPWPKLWGIPILEVCWLIQSTQALAATRLGQSRLGGAGFYVKSDRQHPQLVHGARTFQYQFILS